MCHLLHGILLDNQSRWNHFLSMNSIRTFGHFPASKSYFWYCWCRDPYWIMFCVCVINFPVPRNVDWQRMFLNDLLGFYPAPKIPFPKTPSIYSELRCKVHGLVNRGAIILKPKIHRFCKNLCPWFTRIDTGEINHFAKWPVNSGQFAQFITKMIFQHIHVLMPNIEKFLRFTLGSLYADM